MEVEGHVVDAFQVVAAVEELTELALQATLGLLLVDEVYGHLFKTNLKYFNTMVQNRSWNFVLKTT